jgi:hypothetical protein
MGSAGRTRTTICRAGLVCLSLALAACGGAAPAVPTATATRVSANTPTVANTMTAAPTATATVRPSATHLPTVTPTLTRTPIPTTAPGVLLDTPVPFSGKVITPDNVNQVTELARWGRGIVKDVAYSPDGVNPHVN